MTIQLNKFQRVALRAYAGGDFDHLIDEPPNDELGLGDTLLSFVLIELSDNEDCHTWQDALGRMHSGIQDLNDMLRALSQAEEGENNV